jgi:threonine/homoserine/homoserine lactone efflux protein
LLLIVFGRALFLLVTETSLAGILRNVALVYGGSFLVGLLVALMISVLRKSNKLGFIAVIKNSLITASSIFLFYYGFAIWRWNWPYNDQKGQPMYYENSLHWSGFAILALSIALWIFWNRRLSTSEHNQGE